MNRANNPILLGIETGGTKVLARLVAGGHIVAQSQWPTTSPEAALQALGEWVKPVLKHGDRIAAAGIAAFGPVVVDRSDPRYGEQLATPKPGWTGSNLRASLERMLETRVVIDTDVNAAALAERDLGAHRGDPSLAYLTVGTGIGAGLATEAGTLKGAMHPELGHLPVIRKPYDRFSSVCPFHSGCIEGLAAGPAIRARLGEGRLLSDDPETHGLIAEYLAQLCASIILAWSPHRIVMGGGVGTSPGMIDAVRAQIGKALGGYGVGEIARRDDFLVPASLEHAGLEGALAMAASEASK